MSKLKFVIVLLSFFIVSGCTLSRFQSDTNVNLSSPLDNLMMSSMSDSILSLRFEFPEPYIVGVITDVLFVDSTIFIVDKKQGYIFRYGINGTFLNRIGSQGEGPEDFQKITNVTIDEDYVYVGNISARKIYCYEHNGKFVICIQSTFDVIYDDIVALPDGNFLCHDIVGYKNEAKLWIMGSDGKKKQELLLHKSIYPYSYNSFNSIGYTDDLNVYKILDPISGSLYYYDAANNSLVVGYTFVSDVNGLDKFDGSYDLLSIRDDYAYPLYHAESDIAGYMLWNSSTSIVFHSSFKKYDEMIRVYKRLNMDILDYPCFSLPVSTNLSSAIVAVLTNEYSSDCFPKGYDKNLNEHSCIVNIFSLK